MTKQQAMDEGEDQPRLRLDIHLNLEGIGEPDGPLAWLAQFAKTHANTSPGDKLLELAGNIYQGRRLRSRFLEPSLLGEPVWDMLLALYCFTAAGKSLSVSGLCHSAAVPQTTALRWIQLMEQKNLIKRSRDWDDGRRTLLSLTEESKQVLEEYLAALQSEKP
jgi:DNA-binding MarR family transcriptional regulator